MKKLLIIVLCLATSVSFAEKKIVTKMTKLSVVKLNATGTVHWTGYGIGKSHSGTISLKSAVVEMKGDEPVGGQFVLDMNSLKTPDSERLEKHLKSADFFEVEKFSEGTFNITKIEPIKGAKAGEATHKITGDLTIKGKTHTEVFNAKITKEGKTYSAKADTEIKDRTQYDIVYNSAKFKAASELGNKLIKDEIKIEIDVKTN